MTDQSLKRLREGHRDQRRPTTRTSTTTTSTSPRSGPNLSKDESIGRDGVRAHRLDGEPADQPGEVGRSRSTRPKFPNKANLRAALAAPGLRPDAQVQRAVGERRDRHRVQHRARRARRSRRSTTSSRSTGTKTVLDRDARHRRAVHAVARHRHRRSRPTPTAEPAFDTLAEGGRRRQDRRLQRQRVRERPRRRATSRPRSPGRATSPRSRCDNPDVRFAVPDSGGMLWSDNFMIPYTTDKADLASECINFFYDPKNAAVLTAEIQYISPVDGVAERAHGDGWRGGDARRQPARRTRPTSSSRRCRSSGRSSAAEEEKFDKRFAEITGSG